MKISCYKTVNIYIFIVNSKLSNYAHKIKGYHTMKNSPQKIRTCAKPPMIKTIHSPPTKPAISLARSIHSSTVVKDRPERAQHCESQERADIQGIENGGNNVAEEVQIGIAEVPNCREWLAVPRNIGEPTEQNPNHQNTTVDIQPFGEPGGDDSQRRVQIPAWAVPERRKEEWAGGGSDGGSELGTEFEKWN